MVELMIECTRAYRCNFLTTRDKAYSFYQYSSYIERYVYTEHFSQYVTGGRVRQNSCHFFQFYNLSRINSVCSSDLISVTSEQSLSVTPKGLSRLFLVMS